MKKITTLLFIFSGIYGFSQQIGDYSLTNVLDGKKASLKECSSSVGLIVIFVSNTCPYDEYYYSRIKKVAQEYASKLPVMLVNAHLGDNESETAMKKKAAEVGITVPYLADKDQVLMNSLRATKSPEVFVLKTSGNQFSVFYHGAIDDNAQVEADVHESYLDAAIKALLNGQQPKVAEMRPVGCTIRKK